MMNYGFGGFAGGFFMLLLWILIIVGGVALVQYSLKSMKTPSDATQALKLLEERYAKGEIEKEEFQEKKKDLL